MNWQFQAFLWPAFWILFWIAMREVRHRRRLSFKRAQGAAAADSKPIEDTRQIEDLRQRVSVLERITVDERHSQEIANEIERLRDK